ncbi:type 4a pilus biogenesis protein PilO [Alteromonas gilva]|uniref:Type 4a pilus biogenesis protein PilO n=1 Tax=Alteromonas gilva TaxID=2987522 RepID=A0ABT5L6K9_9ALTE|nr:type 4a pilus biogenesis protein PilO [Alteromonas gilva]MDC8832121.1 type 4a pilus biogenesis protein PilO [Alteromonas gilva]
MKKFDVAKLKEINDLDFEQIAIWPFEVKIVIAFFIILVVSGISYSSIVSPKLPQLEQVEKKEAELKLQFEAKYRLAANLEAYKAQLAQIEEDFSSMLKSLPTQNETPGLLDDITYVGTSSGLTFRLLNWEKEIPKEFYTELPIKIEVAGKYHSFGQFASKVAELPRIVTMHDFTVLSEQGGLRLSLLAKTYRTAATEPRGGGK